LAAAKGLGLNAKPEIAFLGFLIKSCAKRFPPDHRIAAVSYFSINTSAAERQYMRRLLRMSGETIEQIENVIATSQTCQCSFLA